MRIFKNRLNPVKNEKGIALFMVLASISVLSILVTEFTYLAQINQKLAYDQMDHLKAEYLAKSAYKMSLLRLKAYKTIKGLISNKKNPIPLPKNIIDLVWSFPLTYPIPDTLPGITPLQKEKIQKFNEESTLDGNFTALTSAESTKMNLNMLLDRYVPAKEEETKKDDGKTTSSDTTTNTNTNTNTNTDTKAKNDEEEKFDPEQARQNLAAFFTELVKGKIESDEDFADNNQDIKINEIVDNIYAWVDSKFERALGYDEETPTRKGAAFYSIDELHMVPGIDDELYNLFAPNLTTQVTPGINLNKIDKPMLKALFPEFLPEEVEEFFEFRDSTEEDNQFKAVDDFHKYLTTNVASYRGSTTLIDDLKKDFEKRNISLVVDEEVFRLEIRSTVNTATVNLNAVILITEKPKEDPKPSTNPAPALAGDNLNPLRPPKKDVGLKVTYYRMI